MAIQLSNLYAPYGRSFLLLFYEQTRLLVSGDSQTTLMCLEGIAERVVSLRLI